MRKFLLCITLLLLATTLVAKEVVLRVGFLSSNAVNILDEVVQNTAVQVLDKHPSVKELAKSRYEIEREREYQEKVHAALKADNWQSVSKEDELIVSGLEIVNVDFPYWDDKALQLDEAEHIIRSNSLDLLFTITGSNDGALLDYTITLHTLDGSKELLSSLAILHKAEGEREKIVKAFSDFFLPEYGYIKLNNTPSNLIAYVDGVRTDINNALIFVTPGVHTLSFSSINKQNFEVEVEVENKEFKTLDLIFASLHFPQLELVTVPFDAEINVQGMDGAIGHYFASEQSLPFAINSQREGFADLNLQINEPLFASTLELRPKWMDNDNRVKNAKDEMYKALRNTLLSFGSYVLISSLENIYSEEFRPYSGPIKLTFSSISIISLLDFLYKSGKYYHAAEQTYY